MARSIIFAKTLAMLGFVVLVATTYFVRSEVLDLNEVRLSADDTMAQYQLEQFEKDYPDRVQEYESAFEHYKLLLEAYRLKVDEYRADPTAYLNKPGGRQGIPNLPRRPTAPPSPELQRELAHINAQFRSERFKYFQSAHVVNMLAGASAVALVSSLLFLLLFDTKNQRLFYVVVLSFAFVFLIGPSFHSIMTAIVGMLRPPTAYYPSQYGQMY